MVTIFTPTYNRAYIIGELYKSLCAQTYKDFEWLIVDDGSSDNTEELIQSFIDENKITIRYIKQENGGKHRAINRGTQAAKGELFSIVDSDDYLAPNAVEMLFTNYSPYKDDDTVARFSNPRMFKKGEDYYSGKSICCGIKEFIKKYPSVTEHWDSFKTKVLRKYPFPDIPGENFCSESIVFTTIGVHYKCLFFFGKYYIGEYVNDGLTVSSLKTRIKNPLYAQSVYQNKIELSMDIIPSYLNYWRFVFHAGNGNFFNVKFQLASYILLPLSYLIYLRDRYKLRKLYLLN